MKVQIDGNAKLGTRVSSISRPVGDTCPPCEFLGNGCYAERTETLRPNVRASAMSNMVLERNKLRSHLLYAHSIGAAVRLHVSGDFMNEGKLDREYLADLRWAIESITSRGGDLPDIWVYSHVLRKEVAALASLGVKVYASVTSRKAMAKARKAGFALFAWADVSEEFVSRFPMGGKNHKPRIEAWKASAPSQAVIDGERFVLCPEQRKKGRVTCTGSIDSIACGLCVKGRANVLFAKH